MATTFSTNISTNVKLYLEITVVSQNIASNYTTVRGRLYAAGTGNGAWNNMATSGYVIINGNKQTFTLASYDFSGSVNVTLKTTTDIQVPHNADGTKTISVSGYWNPDNSQWLDAKTVSGSVPLATIPRAASFTVTSTSAGSSTIPISITQSPAATGYTISATVAGSTFLSSRSIAGNASTIAVSSADWTAFNNATKSVTSATVTFTLVTLGSGGASLGSKTATCTISYPSTVIPTFSSITAAEQTSIVASVFGAGKYLQNLSKIKFTINGAAGIQSSTISAYSITIGGTTYSSSTVTYVPTTTGTISYSAKVQDSRGRWSAVKSGSVVITAYSPPTITSSSVLRCDSAGTIDVLGTYLKSVFTGRVTSTVNGTEKNQLYYQIDDVTGTTANKVAKTLLTGMSVTNQTNIFGGGAYAAASTYQIKITITDAYGQTGTATLNVSTSSIPLCLGTTGAGVGTVFNTSDSLGTGLQVGGTAHFLEDVYLEKSIRNKNGISMTAVNTIVSNGTDLNTLVDSGFYRLGSGNTNAPANADYGSLLVVRGEVGDTISQYLVPYNTDDMHYRSGNPTNVGGAGAWRRWKTVVAEVERGGDVNNGYVKYSNGEMEQWKSISFATQPINQALGTYEFWSGIKPLGNWAVAFYSIAETASFELATSDAGMTVNLAGSNTTIAGNVYLVTRRALTPIRLNITIRARGRWRA